MIKFHLSFYYKNKNFRCKWFTLKWFLRTRLKTTLIVFIGDTLFVSISIQCFVHNKSSIIFGLKLYTCNASCNDAHGGMAKHWGRIEYFTVLGENFPHHHLSIKNFGIVCPSLGPYFSSSNWRGGHPCCV